MGHQWIDTLPEIEEIIRQCEACHLAMTDENNLPYLVPMNFGYRDGWIYFHGDQQGKKMELLRKNPIVSISMSTGHTLFQRHEQVACSYGMEYKSVVIRGKVELIEDYNEKLEALSIIMAQYTDKDFTFSQPSVINVAVFKVPATTIRGKIFGRFIR